MRHDPIRAAGAADVSPVEHLALATALLRTAPTSPLARVLAWREAVAAGLDREAVLAREAVLRLVGDDPARLLAVGHEAVRHGAFAQAEELFDLAGPQHDHAMLLVRSALRHEAGDGDTAAALLRAAARAAPIVVAPGDASGPLILRARSLEAASYRLRFREGEGFHGTFTGGHVAIDHLLDLPARRLATVNLLDDEAPLEQAMADKPALLINTLACADHGADGLAALGRFLAAHPRLPVINRPEAVARTARDRAAALLGGIAGARFPAIRRYARADADEALADRIVHDFPGPVIVRQVGTHARRSVALVSGRQALLAHLATLPPAAELYVTAYEDTRDGHGVHRKGRAFLVDGKLYPVALLAADEWRVRSCDRDRVAQDDRLRAEERAYLADPVRALGMRRWSALRAVCAGTRLDFVGVDFAPTADGVLILGVGPVLRHDLGDATDLPDVRSYRNRVGQAFRAMVDRRLTGQAR